MQVLIQTLLSRQLSTVRKVILEPVVVVKLFDYLMIAIQVVPYNLVTIIVPLHCRLARCFDPSVCFGRSFDKLTILIAMKYYRSR